MPRAWKPRFKMVNSHHSATVAQAQKILNYIEKEDKRTSRPTRPTNQKTGKIPLEEIELEATRKIKTMTTPTGMFVTLASYLLTKDMIGPIVFLTQRVITLKE